VDARSTSVVGWRDNHGHGFRSPGPPFLTLDAPVTGTASVGVAV
jgi:hypothetical protein